MKDSIRFPFYAKLAFVLLSLISIFIILYLGQNIIVPILMSLLFAILLRPIAHFLKSKWRFPHVLAVTCTVVLFVLMVIGILFFISWQISAIANDWDAIQTNLSIHFDTIQKFISSNFNLNNVEQKVLIDNASKNVLESGKNIIGTSLVSVSDVILNLTLIPIYIFLFLLYRTLFITFLSKLFQPEYHEKLQDILYQIKVSVQSYIVGLLIEMVIVSTLTSVGFMIIGLKYAIVLGLITGLLNLIPYIGILFAGILSIIATLTASPDITLIIGVLIIVIVVQLIDNNLIVPMIVGSKVQINAFVSIVGIIVGGVIAGFSGMFLAIPIIAILKVIFDRIESLEPWGYLMSDDLPKNYSWKNKSTSEIEKPIDVINFKTPIIHNMTIESDEIDLN
jgi:predicted PurR-regulated permease PerM